jgi:hypothetical protein
MNRAHAVIVFLLLGGCMPAGVNFTTVDLDSRFDAVPNQKIAVDVQDQRSYIVNGMQKPDFVGVWQAKYPLHFYTSSGNPLAEDLSDLITKSLRDRGLDAMRADNAGREHRDVVSVAGR